MDLERLKEVSEDDPERMRDFAELFLREADELMRRLEEGIKANSATEVNRLAHKLAGAAATCGMAAMVGPVRALERQSKQARWAETGQLWSQASRQLESTRRWLAEHRLAAPSEPRRGNP